MIPRIHVADIQRKVCERWGLPKDAMTTQARPREVARPRQVAMYLCRTMTGLSLANISARFGDRDHTTTIHAVKTIEALMVERPAMAHAVRELRLELEAECGADGIAAAVHGAQMAAWARGDD